MKRREVLSLMSCLPFAGLMGFKPFEREKGYVIYEDNNDTHGCYSERCGDSDCAIVFKTKEEALDKMEYLVADECNCGCSVFEVDNKLNHYGLGKQTDDGYVITKVFEVLEV